MAANVTVRLDPAAVERMLRAPGGFVAVDLTRRAINVESAAKRVCPVDTGRLRSSITHSLATDERGLLALIGTNVEYARYVEFGTRRMRAQPYLRPSLRAGR